MLRLRLAQAQQPGRRGSGREDGGHPGGIEAVVLRLVEIEARADLAAHGHGGEEIGAAAAGTARLGRRQFGRRQRRRKDSAAEVRPRRHRIAEVERATHRAVDLRSGGGRQRIAEDQRVRLAVAAAAQMPVAQRADAVFLRGGDARAAHRQQHAPGDQRCVVRQFPAVEAADPAGELCFGGCRSGSAHRCLAQQPCRGARPGVSSVPVCRSTQRTSSLMLAPGSAA